MAEVSRVRDDVKLFFLGTEHPDFVTGLLFDPPREAIELSMQLGVYERSVFFNVGWVPYNDIGNFLSEADIGVCAGFDNIEARYAFRTRFVDLFWAELPIICTPGDVLAERVERDPLGIVVPPGDVEAFADAILRLVDDHDFRERCRGNMPAIKEELSWERILAPLVEFCRSGESIAAPKSRRLLPLIGHGARYVLTHTTQQVTGR
jgi:glycosyltransferase involved in cell wall biosynthesis